MYSYIKGIITAKDTGAITIETGGVGYLVVPTQGCFDSSELGEVTTLHTHLSITETAHTLYGFASNSERELFKQLLSVSGVGAKTAVSLLSPGADALASAITSGNSAVLASVKGVSRKTAEKVVIELQEKLLKSGILAGTGAVQLSGRKNTEADDALSALINLGVPRAGAFELIKSIDTKNMSAEEIIVAALAQRGGAL